MTLEEKLKFQLTLMGTRMNRELADKQLKYAMDIWSALELRAVELCKTEEELKKIEKKFKTNLARLNKFWALGGELEFII
jgi:hypothetical protein